MINKTIVVLVLMLGVTSVALAGIGAAPEIDATAAVGAIALLSGGALVIRGRRRKS